MYTVIAQRRSQSLPLVGHRAGYEIGTARRNTSTKNPVLNKHDQVWYVQNVIGIDGACMASTTCQNASLSYMALTARAADFAVNEIARRKL